MTCRQLILVLVVVAAVASAAFAAESDWPMARYDEAQSGYTPAKLEPPLTLCWQFNGAKFDGNPSAPAVVDGVAYFASGDRLYAVDANTGEKKWQYPAAVEGLRSPIRTGITVWQNTVIFGGMDGYVYALDAKTGRAVWVYATQRAIKSSPVVSDGVVYVGSDDNNLYALDAETGELVWTGPFRTKDDVHTTAAVSPGSMVVFASMDANVYSASISSGKLRWSFQLPMSPMRSCPVIASNLVFVGSGSSVYALSTKNGQFRYKIDLPSDVSAPPAVVGSDLYVVCRNRRMYAFTTGLSGYRPKWEKSVEIGLTTNVPPTVAGNVVYVGTMRGLICAYSADDGRLLWRYNAMPSFVGNGNKPTYFTNITAPMVVANNALYVVTDDGALRCFRSTTPDQTPPCIYNTWPMSEWPMNGFAPLTIMAILLDQSTGIDESSIQFLIDGEKKDVKFDPVTLKVWHELPITSPPTKLESGRRTITIIAKDWKGNELKHSWSIMIDNNLPMRPLPKSAKAEPKPRQKAAPKPAENNPPASSDPPPPPAFDGGPPPPPGMPGPGQ